MSLLIRFYVMYPFIPSLLKHGSSAAYHNLAQHRAQPVKLRWMRSVSLMLIDSLALCYCRTKPDGKGDWRTSKKVAYQAVIESVNHH